ncbi:MAG: transcriptional repressor LexA [Lysobacterales bacterium]|jgi:repressor LexA
MSLTDRQQAILDFLSTRLAQDGSPPSLAEIAEAFGFKQARSAQDHLRALEAKGLIELKPGKARGIRLLMPTPEAGLPLVGRVAAGRPILADAHIERHVAVDPGLFRPRAHFLLRVQGDSMVDAAILDGDLIAVHRTPEARDGQIVVARIEDEITVKRLRQREGRLQLLSENPAYAPIEVDASSGDSFAIEGLFVGVLRLGTGNTP